jgi:hypothetical protein
MVMVCSVARKVGIRVMMMRVTMVFFCVLDRQVDLLLVTLQR